MRIALDAMGSDDAPHTEIAGSIGALRELDDEVEIVLVGDQSLIESGLARHADIPRGRLHVEHTPDSITAEDSPTLALRRKPRASMMVGLQLHKVGEADAFISAGPTGAMMASSQFILRTLPGVGRPGVGALLPTARDQRSLMVDAGANIDCKPANLLQFARLGSIYAQDMLGRENPCVGLLNIGEEPDKGNDVAVETYRLLAASGLNFAGNVEGRDIIRGGCDVLVCDGFVGNLLLKFYESVSEFIIDILRKELDSVGSDLDLGEIFRELDYAEIGGAPLLGLNGVSIVCHGSSTPKAIQNAVRGAVQAVRSGMVAHMASELAETQSAEERA